MIRWVFLFFLTWGLIILPVSALCEEQGLIDLYPGWNFISVPHTLSEGYNTGSIFSSVNTANHSIWMYKADSSSYVRVTPGTLIHPLNGIWIYSNSRTSVPVRYSQEYQLVTKQLYPGWNAVGFAGCTHDSANNSFFLIKGHWSRIIGYDANAQVYEAVIINQGIAAHSDERLLNPTKGYWIHIRDICSISYNPVEYEPRTAHQGDIVFIHLTMRDDMGRPVLTTNEEIFHAGSQKGESIGLAVPLSISVGSEVNETIVPIPAYYSIDSEQVHFAFFSLELNQIASSLTGMKSGEKKIIGFTYPTQQMRIMNYDEFSILGGNLTTVKLGDQILFGFYCEPVGSALRTVYISAKNETSISINYGLATAEMNLINFSNTQ